MTGEELSYDGRRAVLLAAIAAEVRIRDALREKTPASREELVEVILKNYREIDIAIGQLPHKVMKAAVGRSLQEDDSELFGRVQALFQLRNEVAHWGIEPTKEKARDAVLAANALAMWLDELPQPAP